MIITLHYKPGEYINESEICAKLNFTRAPVHQAIHRLASDRLIQIIPQKGIIVQPLSIDEMKNIRVVARKAKIKSNVTFANNILEIEQLLYPGRLYTLKKALLDDIRLFYLRYIR